MRKARWLAGLVWLSTTGCTSVLGDDYRFDLGGAAGTGGAAGSAGVSGSSGQSGAAGGAGTAGTAGTAGVSGASGVAGTAGMSGASGAAGMSGTAGTAGTAGQGGGGTGGSPFVCGDQIREGAEECDTKDVNGLTCTTALGLLASGALGCHADCTRDYDNCHYCGDGKKGGSEECDGTDLGTDSCASVTNIVGAGGVLACTSLCTHDTSACTFCGNGKLEGSEKCDGTNLDGASCSSVTGKVATGTLSCTPGCVFDTTKCQSCGNGTRDGSEVCEGTDLGGATCASVVGAGSTGTLGCSTACGFDLTGCSTPTSCGDMVTNGTDQCDGPIAPAVTCATALQRPGATGTLTCTSKCTFDTTKCFSCGDGVINGTEQCDGVDLGGATCKSLNPLASGTLKCKSDCTLDQTGCSYCGDGMKNAGEACDKTDLGGTTCASLIPGASGTLTCSGACAYDKTSCQYCGDGTLNNGEKCDGTDFGGATCLSLVGFGSMGALKCAPGCGSIVTTGCSPAISCGDGVVDSTKGEECDGSVPGGVTCATATNQLSATGTLSCTNNCLLDRSQCHFCGNNVQDISGEACDGTDLTGAACPSGYGGNPKCDGMCQVDTSSCTCASPRAECSSQGLKSCVDVQNDANNCGYCGHSCLGAKCSSGVCASTQVPTLKCAPSAFVIDSSQGVGFVVGVNGTLPCLVRADLTTGNTTALGTNLSALLGARLMVADATSLYVAARDSSSTTTQIVKVDRTSGQTTILQSLGKRFPQGMCLAGSSLFLSSTGQLSGKTGPHNTVDLIPLQLGASPTNLLDLSAENVVRGAACTTNNFYFGYNDSKYPVETVSVAGTLSVLVDGNQPALSQIALFSTSLYWTLSSNSGLGQVVTAPIGGGMYTSLLNSPTINPVSLAVDGQGIYWSDAKASSVNYLGLDGTVKHVLGNAQNPPSGLQLDSQNVYYLTQPGTTNAALFRVPR